MKTAAAADKSRFEASLVSFRWFGWISAMLVAVLLNSVLFLVLPMLNSPSDNSQELKNVVNRVQVIRLKKKEPPAQKTKPKPPDPPKPEPQPKKKVKAPKPKNSPRLTLPFQLNTKMPAIDGDFKLNYSDKIAFGPAFKGAVAMGELDQPLTPVARIPPVYPIRARRKGVEGWVRVGFEVDEQGHVDNLLILDADPKNSFEKSVIQCVSKWRYKPGTVEGVPVRAKMETTIRFKLE